MSLPVQVSETLANALNGNVSFTCNNCCLCGHRSVIDGLTGFLACLRSGCEDAALHAPLLPPMIGSPSGDSKCGLRCSSNKCVCARGRACFSIMLFHFICVNVNSSHNGGDEMFFSGLTSQVSHRQHDATPQRERWNCYFFPTPPR